jgi:hypothetical protein
LVALVNLIKVRNAETEIFQGIKFSVSRIRIICCDTKSSVSINRSVSVCNQNKKKGRIIWFYNLSNTIIHVIFNSNYICNLIAITVTQSLIQKVSNHSLSTFISKYIHKLCNAKSLVTNSKR